MSLATAILQLYGLCALYGAVFTINTIGAEKTRRHPLAAAMTAAICGLLWPILVFVDLSKGRR